MNFVRNMGANLIIDEAHSTGVCWRKRQWVGFAGWVWKKRCFLRIYTFGKAMGGTRSLRGLVSQVVRDYLVNFCQGFLFIPLRLPQHSLISIRSAFDYLRENPDLQQKTSKGDQSL